MYNPLLAREDVTAHPDQRRVVTGDREPSADLQPNRGHECQRLP